MRPTFVSSPSALLGMALQFGGGEPSAHDRSFRRQIFGLLLRFDQEPLDDPPFAGIRLGFQKALEALDIHLSYGPAPLVHRCLFRPCARSKPVLDLIDKFGDGEAPTP